MPRLLIIRFKGPSRTANGSRHPHATTGKQPLTTLQQKANNKPSFIYFI